MSARLSVSSIVVCYSLFQNQSRAIGLVRIGPELLVAVEEVEVPLDISEQEVGDEKDLSGAENQVDGEEVVCIGAAVVDPEMMEERPQHGRGQEHVGHDEELLGVGEQVLEDRQKGQVEADIAVGGI